MLNSLNSVFYTCLLILCSYINNIHHQMYHIAGSNRHIEPTLIDKKILIFICIFISVIGPNRISWLVLTLRVNAYFLTDCRCLLREVFFINYLSGILNCSSRALAHYHKYFSNQGRIQLLWWFILIACNLQRSHRA